MKHLSRNIFLTLLFHLLVLPLGFAQIMHLSSVSFDDISINPSVLSTSRLQQNLSVQQFNSYTSGSFVNHSKIQFSKKVFKPFMGAGITAQQTNFRGNSLTSIGFSYSYSTVLFNVIRFHAGVTGSAIRVSNKTSLLDFYEQSSQEYPSNKTKWLGNLNYSFALSFMKSRFHLSYSKVNGHPFQTEDNNPIEWNTSHIVQFGNFLAFSGVKERNYLGLIAVFTPLTLLEENIQAYFTKVRLNLQLSRKSNFLYGGTFGWHSNGIIQLIPNVGMAYQSYSYGLQFNYFSKSNVNELSNLIGVYFSIKI
jgi:hypothetical protein